MSTALKLIGSGRYWMAGASDPASQAAEDAFFRSPKVAIGNGDRDRRAKHFKLLHLIHLAATFPALVSNGKRSLDDNERVLS